MTLAVGGGRRDGWTSDETVAALAVARRTGACVRTGDREVLSLSTLLRACSSPAWQHGPAFRSPHGVMRKVRRLAALDTAGEAWRGRATPLERQVVARFADGGEDLAEAEAKALDRLRDGVPFASIPTRGPAPCPATQGRSRAGVGPASLYLAVLRGARLADGRLFAKIGFSEDVGRRMRELGAGLPTPLGIAWVAVATRSYASATDAYDAEQAALARAAAGGLSIGGEFVAVSADALRSLVGDVTGRSCPPRPPRGRTDRAWRPDGTTGRVRRRGPGVRGSGRPRRA